MEDYESLVVNLEHDEDDDIGAGLRRINPQLPKEVRLHLGDLLSQFLRTGGREQAFKQMHGKTVGELLKISTEDARPIRSGSVDGVTFKLYEKPSNGESS